MNIRPDPTFYPSPKLAMEAPGETIAYALMLSPDFSKPDALAVIDVRKGTYSYGKIVHTVAMPNKGDEFHHFGWNACSLASSPLSGHAFLERRYLIIPGMRSSRIDAINTKPDPKKATIHKIIEPEEVFRKTGYSSRPTPSTVAQGIYVSTLGGAGPGSCRPVRLRPACSHKCPRATVDGVGPRIAGLAEHFLGFDDLVDRCLLGIGLGVDHIDARRAHAGDDKITAFQEGMARERRQRRTTGIPTEVVELVTIVGHGDGVNDLAVRLRALPHIDDGERVRLGEIRAQHQRIGDRLAGRLHREFRRWVECRVWADVHARPPRAELLPCGSGTQFCDTLI